MVSEPGVYRLIFRSTKSIAERFKRWLAHEVIPEIRCTGSYSGDSSDAAQGSKRHERLLAIREIRQIAGSAAAWAAYRGLGLPIFPGMPKDLPQREMFVIDPDDPKIQDAEIVH